MSGLRPGAMIRLGLLCAGATMLVPLQLVALRLGARHGWRVPRLFHRLACACLGVRCITRGKPPPKGAGGLIVANHVSWLDISVLGATRPLCFVAKAEVSGWPIIGFLASLQRTLFIDRTRRSATAGTAAAMGERLSDGHAVVLFGEGTTGDGTRTLPLRSALLGAVQEALDRGGHEDVIVYPLAITYMGFHGIVGGRVERSALAWYGDTELAPHIVAMLNAGAIDVELAWGEPIRMVHGTSRKAVARQAEQMIRLARREAVIGRPGP